MPILYICPKYRDKLCIDPHCLSHHKPHEYLRSQCIAAPNGCPACVPITKNVTINEDGSYNES